MCRPVAQFCRLRSYCAELAAATLATFCRQFHPLTGPKCWRTSITLSYGTRYDRHSTLSYLTSFRRRFNSTRSTYRSFMGRLYESSYVDTSNNVVCGGLSSLAMNSDHTADHRPPYSNVTPLPEYLLWPRTKHGVLWFLTNYIITRCTVLSSLDYIDFMRRTRWYTYRCRKCAATYGHYLDVCT